MIHLLIMSRFPTTDLSCRIMYVAAKICHFHVYINLPQLRRKGAMAYTSCPPSPLQTIDQFC